MPEIYAASLSVSQGAKGPKLSAHLVHSDDGRTTEAHLEWPILPPINAGGNSSEWLYSLLSRTLMEYDAHTVVSASTHPVQDFSVVNQREA